MTAAAAPPTPELESKTRCCFLHTSQASQGPDPAPQPSLSPGGGSQGGLSCWNPQDTLRDQVSPCV